VLNGKQAGQSQSYKGLTWLAVEQAGRKNLFFCRLIFRYGTYGSTCCRFENVE
jgi:hypothetical protein